jgi:hypothetical protein
MVCPKCHRDYARDVFVCPACDEDLVDLAPGPRPVPDAELVQVFATANPALVAMAKSLLEEDQIDYIPRNEGLQTLGFVGPAFFVEFMVRPDDAERARALLEDLAPATDDTTGDDAA